MTASKPDPVKAYVAPPTSQAEYYRHIGEFIVAYAQAECALHELARKLCGLKEAKARALFAGMRLGDIKSRTLAILRLSNRSKATKAEIEACLEQLDIIGRQRDKLAHRYASYDGGKLKITNEMTAKSMLEYEQDILAVADLINLNIDCLRISIRLAHITTPSLKRTARKSLLQSLHQPWSYKAVPPEIRKKPTKAQLLAEILRQRASSPT